MPHLNLESFNPLTFPAHCGEVEFLFQADYKNPDEGALIATRYKGREFFLVYKNGAKKLLKGDKVTRPSPNFILKHALSAYAECSGSPILDSNVDNAPENAHLKTHDALKSIQFFADNFPKDREVRIEVGFGSARHLLHQASANPDVLFIGLEIHKPSIEQALKQIVIQNLTNIMILDYDARLFLEFVPSNIVGKVYVHFPVPWDKKPHRRVISEAFLKESERALRVGGTLELRTDSENYYRFALETFSTPRQSRFEVRKNQEIAIVSKYEDRWKKQEKNIYDVTFTCDIESPEPDMIGDFTFSEGTIDADALYRLSKETYKRDWGFIHVERMFSVGKAGSMIRLSMGSFDRPESTYVLLENGAARYYPSLPVRSSANLKAHILLDELLHG
ncbi:MAG: tRNA (guanosine(46)-N7)-methyltransferase TrmB [Sulfuricurvum sp. GWF2_44_89]|uniref:tRNA (guanine-N(7)-)-methyltransferase n=2 Tax=Sulfuricurvum TaxID=286130 RepID=A0A2D3WFZ9_9BACT|nr:MULTISPECIES: tRNA (guanosine(46)-N7)-methyltransferase TrmB [Sulfuricurvum]OHD78250.1 MAG: tRNA (guanosine(46)-N7)-methyltransferase TrmB [Sulfuricurvum sp. GWF2_44_89]OHD91557.1 MAG: tRNA (guanosine(46)-N7)-methyltransferase TrmB [Sulfuricurvum sp. RIFOXYD12_FULL_44_77]DAB38835.1 MAG TPA: tRNA (guanosine(46)-N7)-methyltransferase TrmB [Sulfuricurvum kujiense]